jgi:hypothetical protein
MELDNRAPGAMLGAAALAMLVTPLPKDRKSCAMSL